MLAKEKITNSVITWRTKWFANTFNPQVLTAKKNYNFIFRLLNLLFSNLIFLNYKKGNSVIKKLEIYNCENFATVNLHLVSSWMKPVLFIRLLFSGILKH